MAVLTDQDRFEVWADVMRQTAISLALDEPIGNITKQDLRAAIDALDVWLNDNAASANSAIPLPARTALSARQKAALLMYVISKRYLRS